MVVSASRFPDIHRSGALYGQLFDSNCREQISIAYVQAVVTAARCKLEEIRIDDETVDAVIRQDAEHPLYDGASLDIQLKCTSQNVLRRDSVAKKLSRRHYDKLRNPKRPFPRILVVMIVPLELESWISQDEEGLRLVGCAYWDDLKNKPTKITNEVTVRPPRKNIFCVEQLLGILGRIGSGEMT